VFAVDENNYNKPSNMTATLTIEALPTYHVTVIEGSGSGDYEEGETVTITANTAPSGKVFDKWVTTNDISFANEFAPSTTFVVIAQDVTVEATYKDLPPNEYSITVETEGAGSAYASANSATAGTIITLTAEANSGWSFKMWSVIEGNITLANTTAAITTFTMPAENVIVKALFEQNDGVNELTIDNGQLTIYPNPTQGKLTIDNGGMEIENVEVYDLLGRFVGAYPCGRPNSAKAGTRESAKAAGAITIDISHLPRGAYIIKVDSKIGRFVKN
jgi:hypothetical protein